MADHWRQILRGRSGRVNESWDLVVVPFDLHRSRPVLPDALDFGHAQTRTVPAIGICEHCNAQFKFGGTTRTDAEFQIKSAFAVHKCILLDSSQNALRIVREATDGK